MEKPSSFPKIVVGMKLNRIGQRGTYTVKVVGKTYFEVAEAPGTWFVAPNAMWSHEGFDWRQGMLATDESIAWFNRCAKTIDEIKRLMADPWNIPHERLEAALRALRGEPTTTPLDTGSVTR